jgi:hypothetical protein
MNPYQEKVRKFMDQQIDELNHGMKLLKDHDKQPTCIGDLYNGMLKNSVDFETKHMEHLRDELVKLLS